MMADRSRSSAPAQPGGAARAKWSDRVAPLLRYVIVVAVLGPVLALVMWLIDRHEPVLEAVFDGMFMATWLVAGLIIGQEHGPGATRQRDPETEQLRQAVRAKEVPADGRLRAALTERVDWLRRGALRALAGGTVLFGGLALVGLLAAEDVTWAVIFGLVLVVFAAVVAWNLSRLRRLSSRLG